MTYIYNHIPSIITVFEHMGSFSDLRLDLNFACYILSKRNIGPCYWPTKVSMDDFWPLQKELLGYISMNDHRGPLIKASGRAEYEVLVPIYGLTPQDKDELNHAVEVLTLTVDGKFIAKLAPWPYGHYNEAIFDGLDDIIDDIVTEDFDEGSFSQLYTEDHTTVSFQQDYVYGFMPSSSTVVAALVLGMLPSQTPASEDFVNIDELVLPQMVGLSEELHWVARSTPDDNSHCQFILGELPVDHSWSLIIRSLKMSLFGSLITGRYGNTMRVVKLWPF
ncbi:hypothetical protein F4604DRAFT_1678598 [Suillus subluteus]|nr:hypothetical protein F4604DRAFT_1678598 [Suillus subluteus]